MHEIKVLMIILFKVHSNRYFNSGIANFLLATRTNSKEKKSKNKSTTENIKMRILTLRLCKENHNNHNNVNETIDIDVNNIQSKRTMFIIQSKIRKIILIIFILITLILLLIMIIIINNDNVNKVVHFLIHHIQSRFTQDAMIQSNQVFPKVTILHNIKLIFKHDWWDVNHFKLLLKNHELKLSITIQVNGIFINLSNGLAIKTSINRCTNYCNLNF